MECATWGVLCKCPPDLDEADRDGEGPCPTSATGVHRYFDGDPHRPIAECWTRHYSAELQDAAWELDLPPGRYTVHPWCDGDWPRLDLMAWVACVDLSGALPRARSVE